MRLVVAEKPSVARDIAAALGARRKGDHCFEADGLRVGWCVGHLVELEEPAHYDVAWRRWSLDVLPMLPQHFALRPRKDAHDAWVALRRHLRDRAVREVVNAADAGREGELIFRWVYELSGCRAPVLRLWTSSLTPDALRAAWKQLRPASDFDALGDAARCRAEADWLVGMNATRAMTVRGGGELWSVGRVQTPTLALIVGRDAAIASFVPEDYWLVRADVGSALGPFRALWFGADDDTPPDGDEAPRVERIPSAATAEALANAVRGRSGTVTEAQRSTRREPPPLLYDLTALQRRANQRYGMGADRTLEVAQALYERHKLLTYPRTDARHLTPAEAALLPGILGAVAAIPVYQPVADVLRGAPLRLGRRIVDASEVGDHHAILPTDRVAVPDRLAPDEKRIYDLVVRRLLAALSPDAVFDLARIVVQFDAPDAPLPPRFRARGRVERVAGWRAVDPPGRSRDVDLPAVEVGHIVRADDASAVAEVTRPPRPYDDASLLGAMEGAGKALDDEALRRAMRGSGLGTPATRASILSTLIERGYVVRDGRALRATPRGATLIEVLPVDELKSAELTGRWEERLFAMAERRDSRAAFRAAVDAHVTQVVAAIASVAAPPTSTGEAVGACPRCGGAVAARRSDWACSSGCGFAVPRRIARREVSDRMRDVLLRGGTTAAVKGFRRKDGAPFAAALRWDDAAGKVAFVFGERPSRPGKRPAVRAGDACPECGQGIVMQGRERLGCSRWREGCGWRGGTPPS